MKEMILPALYWLLELRKSRQGESMTDSLDQIATTASWLPTLLIAQSVILVVLVILMIMLLKGRKTK